MNVLQFTLTIEEGKELIARGILKHPLFMQARKRGSILLKGGTTVSRIAEKITGKPLRICGRITPRGTVSSGEVCKAPHSVLIKGDEVKNIDDSIIEVSHELGPEDLVICGANAIDSNGRAALMAGSPGGGNVGSAINSWFVEGTKVIIATGLEKLIPGDLSVIVNRTGRKISKISWGMSVGLLLLPGEVFHEIKAVEVLTGLECYPLGAGGLGAANGSITLEATGSKDKIDSLLAIIKEVKDKKNISGTPDSLKECYVGCGRCKFHYSCGYKKGVFPDNEGVK
jgi:hypothetical protein